MEITFLLNGKTTDAYLREGIALYEKRLAHYVRYRVEVIPELKNTKAMSPDQQKTAEGERILAAMAKADHTVLLDERGERRTSVQFADFLQKQMNRGCAICFSSWAAPTVSRTRSTGRRRAGSRSPT